MNDFDGRVDKLKNLLRNGNGISQIIEQSAHTFGVSVPYLKKLFKQHTGKTIIQYDNELRLEKAKEMFEDEETSYKQISEICDAVGYGDVSNFIKDFKRKYDLTPKQFQRQCWRKF